jgi:hypothetical protein
MHVVGPAGVRVRDSRAARPRGLQESKHLVVASGIEADVTRACSAHDLRYLVHAVLGRRL